MNSYLFIVMNTELLTDFQFTTDSSLVREQSNINLHCTVAFFLAIVNGSHR